MSNRQPGLLVAVKDAGQALAFVGAVQPDMGAAAADQSNTANTANSERPGHQKSW